MLFPKALIGVSLILLIIQSASCIWQPYNSRREALCTSEECTKRGNLYKANMNDRVNPCQDFHTFTCGNWLKAHPGPIYPAERSVLDVLVSDFKKITRDTLETYDSKSGGHILFQRAKDIYDICVKFPEYPKTEASAIAKEIKKIGRLPKTPLWDIHTKYLKLTGESAFFRAAVAGQAPEGKPVLIVLEPASAYGSITHDEAWKPEEEQAYTQFLFQIIKSLKLPGSDAQIKERIQKVFEFRKKLDVIIQENLIIGSDVLTPIPSQTLQKWFSSTRSNQRAQIPWAEVMEALYNKLSAAQRENFNLMDMRHEDYFFELLDLLKTVPEEVLAYHMEIYFIERHLRFNNMMYKLLERTSVEPYNRLRYIRERFYPRYETCIENHNMKQILELMLYTTNKKWFPVEQEMKIQQLIGAVKAAIYNKMTNVKWIDEPTLTTTLTKFNDLESWIGFPPWVHGDGGRKPRSSKDILKPNAWLNMRENYLYITAPLLFSPIFSMDIPDIYNYAGLGTTLGHELYHVIDDCGSYPAENGSMIVWWPEKVRKECFKRMNSFIKAYNEITDTTFKNQYDLVVESNTSRTVLENYPDVMGLEVAYNVYKDSVKKDKTICKTLPHFEKYNCDQMFYIAFANTYCGYHSNKSAMRKLRLSGHSIESVRINGAVSQMESFAAAFQCSGGMPMNPLEKVNLWK